MTNLPAVRFKSRPEDFVVHEIPAYEPSGRGGHVYVTFRKTGLTTDDAVKVLAKRLRSDLRQAGVAGKKDKQAVTTQTASFLLPEAQTAEGLLVDLPEGLEILSVSRHENKLKPGHLRGNHFSIWLGAAPADVTTIHAHLLRLGQEGAPNHFGEQRFGRGKDNGATGLAVVRGERPAPRDPSALRFMFSAFQSMLFNAVLDRRIEEGTWATVLLGDLAKKHDTGGLFLASTAEEATDAAERALANLVSATGPMFGASMRRPEGAPDVLEQEILANAGITEEHLARFKRVGEGTRRPLRVLVESLEVAAEPEGLRVQFVLPKGAYATSLLSLVCQWSEVRGASASSAETEGESPA